MNMTAEAVADPTADTAELVDNQLNIKYRLRQFGKFRCLVVLTALLFVLAVVFLTLLFVERAKSSPSSSSSRGSPASPPSQTPSTQLPTQKPSPPPSGPVCYTMECVYLTEEIYQHLNRSVDPCDDFYAYSCGEFFKSHHLTGNKTKETPFTIIGEENINVLKNALENAAASYSKITSVMKTAQIYKSCVNTAAIDNRGKAPLVKLIEEYGGWQVTGGGLNGWSLKEKMGAVLRDLNVQTLLTLIVEETDLKNSSEHILMISSSSLGMSKFYYTNDSSDSLKIRQAYQTYMNTTARLLGAGDLGLQKMADIYDFEKSLTKAIDGDLSSSDDLVEMIKKFHRAGRSPDEIMDKTINDFCNESQFDLSFILGLLNSVFHNQGNTFTGSENVVYGDGSTFSGLASLYSRYASDDSIIKDYIMWRVIDNYIMSMSSQFVDAKMRYEAVLGPQNSSRWLNCIEDLMKPLDMTLGRLFVDAHFDETTKSTVKDMTSRVRQAFIDNLKTADWMDNSTKENAKEKALAIKENVGYPSYIKDDRKLDAHYSSLAVSKDLFENTVAVNKFMAQTNLGMYNKPVNNDTWMVKVGPWTVNAFYSPRHNGIVILPGILHPPFYRKGYPKYLNYGSLAMIIGHEIIHGFDGSGRLFDKNGNYKDWWNLSSEMNFVQRSQCLVNQYNNYKVFGTNMSGFQTLNENIADNGGIKLAYDAYHAWVKENAPEGRLPGQGFTTDQLFFLGFSMPWCSIYTQQAALRQVAKDEHTFPKYRVIGSLSNFDKFAEAFNCPRGSAMNPYNKCSVW